MLSYLAEARRVQSKSRKLAAMLVVGLALAAGGARWARAAWYERQLQPVGAGAPRAFEVKPGLGVGAIAAALERDGLVRSAAAVRRRARSRALAGKLQAGVYQLAPTASVDELLDTLAAGQVSVRSVTFPEGFTLAQCAERAQQAGFGRAEEYLALATAHAADFKLAGLPAGASLEGYLFPDTYRLRPDAQLKDLLAAQVKRFVEVWRALPGSAHATRSRHELVTIASLVEQEARADDERARIAGVIANRLECKMRLQIDASVLYALGHHKARVTKADLAVDSPYNTYRVLGLPPGPIANPGRPSLAAALAPESHHFRYYVLAEDARHHQFAATAAEHAQNVARYRRANAGEPTP